MTCGCEMSNLLSNVHDGIEFKNNRGETYLISNNYEYYHYLCDGFNDRGWGCGYRTLQTLCSWITNNSPNKCKNVPTIREIQQILVDLEDKPMTFFGSRQWIGSFEVCLVIGQLYQVPCKIVHVNKGDELMSITDTLKMHFKSFGSPIMMGGDMDCSSKGVVGLHLEEDDASLLVVDPHYVGKEKSKEFLQCNGWVKWQPLKDFLSSSFYNLCMPQVKSNKI